MGVDSFESMMYQMRNVRKNGPYKGLFDKYVWEMEKWSSDGSMPKSISRNLKYSLEMMAERRKEQNIQIVTKYEKIQDRDVMSVEYPEKNYKNMMYYQAMDAYKTIFHNGKEIKKKKDSEVVYTNVTDVNSYQEVYEEVYNCPNCGAVVKVKELENGCSYCGTKFKLPDLFPKITSYYALETVDSKKVEIKYKLSMFVGICIMEGVMIYNSRGSLDSMKNYPLFAKVLAMLFYVGVAAFAGAFLGMMIYGMCLLFKVVYEAGRSMSLLANVKGSKKKLEERMRKVESDFSYEYFESKLISMLQMLLFSDNPRMLSIYQGNAGLEECKNIIEMAYTGAMGFRKFKVKNGIAFVSMEIFLTNTRLKKDKLKEKDEAYFMTVARRIQPYYRDGFEITKVKCHHCGGSFDAMKIKKCPYCNNEYYMVDDDWVVTELRKSR